MPQAAHRTESTAERALCVEMARQGVDHQHRSLRFRVASAEDADVPYRPGIVVRRGSTLFLVEVIAADDAAAKANLLAGFLAQHSPEIVLVAVVPDDVRAGFPPEAYDELYSDADLARIVRRIREQDPEGFVEPFDKRRPA
jgi:hypothetical protein